MIISKFTISNLPELELFLEQSPFDYWFINEIPNCNPELVLSTPEKSSELSILLLQNFNMFPFEMEIQEEKDWIKTWIDSLKPFNFMENIWINPYKDRKLTPSDLLNESSVCSLSDAEKLFQNIIEVQIEPGTVFGSGEHATTKMAATGFLKYCNNCASFLDIGSGSGILSILAYKKGFRTITAIEHEEKALKFSNSNFLLNNVTVKLFQSDLLTEIFKNKP